MYRSMVITRGVEERGHILYKQGKIPAPSTRGEETKPLRSASARLWGRRRRTPLHRDMGVHIVRGWSPGGSSPIHGPCRRPDAGGRQRPHADRAWPIAMVSHLPAMLPVAVGCALAFRIREEQRVAVGWFGEGASARGDTHEAMNSPGSRRLPVVFVCDNNQWAYSTPTHLEYAVEHVADRAQAYGFEGVVVDGTTCSPSTARPSGRSRRRARAAARR